MCQTVLDALVKDKFLYLTREGAYARVAGDYHPGIVKLTHDCRTAAQFVRLAAEPNRNSWGLPGRCFRQLDNARAIAGVALWGTPPEWYNFYTG